MAPALRNTVVLIAASGLFFLLWRYGGLKAAPMFLLALVPFVWGFGLYFAFDASPALRVVLATVTPVIAGVALEIALWHQGYQFLGLIISGVMALLACVGAIVGSIVLQRHKRRSNEIDA